MALTVRHAHKLVLEEDEYLDALSGIIERDFFPHLQAVAGQLDKIEELDALSSGNPVLMARTFERIRSRRTGVSLGQSETAYSGLSLSEFLGSYTSEDNASFEALQLKDMSTRRRAAHWLYEPGEAESYSAVARFLDPTLFLGLPEPGPSASAAGQKPGMLMLYHTHGQHLDASQRRTIDDRLLAATEPERGDHRPAAPQGNHFRVRNNLMFAPDSDFTNPQAATGGVGLIRDREEASDVLKNSSDHHLIGAAAKRQRIPLAPKLAIENPTAVIPPPPAALLSVSASVPLASHHTDDRLSSSSSSLTRKRRSKQGRLSAAGAALAAQLRSKSDDASNGLTQMLRASYTVRRKQRKEEKSFTH